MQTPPSEHELSYHQMLLNNVVGKLGSEIAVLLITHRNDVPRVEGFTAVALRLSLVVQTVVRLIRHHNGVRGQVGVVGVILLCSLGRRLKTQNRTMVL